MSVVSFLSSRCVSCGWCVSAEAGSVTNSGDSSQQQLKGFRSVCPFPSCDRRNSASLHLSHRLVGAGGRQPSFKDTSWAQSQGCIAAGSRAGAPRCTEEGRCCSRHVRPE